MTAQTLCIVMNSKIEKHGSFEDFMICMAGRAGAKGWQIHYIFPAMGTPSVQAALEAAGARCHVITEDWWSAAGQAALKAKLAEIKPAVANFHFCERVQAIKLFLAARMMGIRIAQHYHGEIRPLHTLNWRQKHLSVLRLISLFSHRIITVSEANRRFLKALHVLAPVDMVYNGIDTRAYREKAEVALAKARDEGKLSKGSEDGLIRFLYLGQLIQRKQVPMLIKAFAQVHRELPNVRLKILGRGPEEALCKETAAQQQLGDAIEFGGFRQEYPFDELYRADAFVTASESESFGLVLAEAMCMRLPVIACRVGGVPEVVGDRIGGILVPPNDPAALQGAMLELARDPNLRKQLAEAGYRRVNQQFDLPDKVDELLEYFHRV